MPNHVYSNLRVTGPEEDIARFKEAANLGDKVLSLDGLYPMPADLVGTKSPAEIVTDEEYAAYMQRKADGTLTHTEELCGGGLSQSKSDELIELHGFNDWYGWAHANWGTKWGIYEAELVDDSCSPTELMYRFQTAWSPATSAWTKISSDWPTLTFETYCEDEGGSFATREDFSDGEQTRDDNVSDVRSSSWYEMAEHIASLTQEEAVRDASQITEELENEGWEESDLTQMLEDRIAGEAIDPLLTEDPCDKLRL